MGGGNVGDGVILDLTALPRRFELDAERRAVRSSASACLADLNLEADAAGLRLPPDPSSGAWATVGGMVSTNAAGARSVRYGSVRRWVEAIELVTADAEVVELRRACAAAGTGAPALRDGNGAPDSGRDGGDRRPLSADPQELLGLCPRSLARLRRCPRSRHRRRRHARRRHGGRVAARPAPARARRTPGHAPLARLAGGGRGHPPPLRSVGGRAARPDLSRARRRARRRGGAAGGDRAGTPAEVRATPHRRGKGGPAAGRRASTRG